MTGIIIYDGSCNLCNRTVRFIKKHDNHCLFSFAALQSVEGASLLATCGAGGLESGSVILIHEGRYYARSTAVLVIMKLLGGCWRIIYALKIIPEPVRNFFYRIVARNRFRWFGRTDAC